MSGVSGPEVARLAGRVLLAAALLVAGTAHFVDTEEFYAQIPEWFPLDETFVVLASGLVELVLGLALLSGWRKVVVGWTVAALFVVVFPGNISQYVTGTDAFGLDTDTRRLVRLFFQPVLVVWALWCTGAWSAWRRSKAG